MLYPAIFRDLVELEQKIKTISAKNVIGVCPGPALADKYREYLQRIDCDSTDVVTVFKFAQNLLSCDPNFDSNQFCNKSRLLLSLATLWKAHLSELSLADFQLAHKIFTDLRGHFLVPDFLETVLADFRPDVKRCVLYFWHFLQSAKILDEHGVYGELAHQLRTPAHPAYEYLPSQTYLFFGFRHFTGVQVDFLKSLAIKHDVHIFIPEPAYLSARATDWITWLFPDRKTVPPVERDISSSAVQCQIIRPAYNRHSELLIKQLAGGKATNIILAKNELSSGDLCSIYHDNYFKLESQFFSGILEALTKSVLARIESSRTGFLSVEAMHQYIDDECRQKLAEKDFRNQRAIKVILLVRANLQVWQELSAKNTKVDGDIWKMICEASQLDLPRNYLIPVAFSRHSSSITSISGLELDHSPDGSILVVSEQYGEIISDGSAFSDSMLVNIAPLSPVKSADLEKNFLKFWLDIFLSGEKNRLLYEEGIEERSFFWKMILGSLKQKGYGSENRLCKKVPVDVLARYITQTYRQKKLTPSRMQNYCDCPRKFYFQEIHECRLDKTTQLQLESFELGEIEHLVIKDFFEKNLELNDDSVTRLVDLHLREYLEKRILKIKKISLPEIQKEIFEYSMNGIKILNDLIALYHFTTVRFEIPFSEVVSAVEYKGRIDCILENEDGYAILDFKRGAGSIPTLKAFDKFEKLQVWFYLAHADISKKILCFGLICLSEPDETLLRSVMDVGTLECGDLTLKGIPREDYERKLSEYRSYEEGLQQDLYADDIFKASPLKAQTCDFCDLSALCSKGQI
ncbi:MAG: hypothetical protein A2X86_09850 [Bdellovibrionales bacterium GWA2_49_15]|nr:MAG: hypothetical protein A2X86_09850 [Bdellovibrionales bacterium GWA2_49_15]HAZ13086.1 hypothetical protein [Bdellovibrionales bacterium]